MSKWFNSKRRKWIYGITVAAMPLIGFYFGIDAARQEEWLNLAGAILVASGGLVGGLAGSNVNDDPDAEDEYEYDDDEPEDYEA